MKYRSAQLLAPEDLGAAGTKVINLDLDQIISAIDIRFQTTKASQGQSEASPGNITKIELVDGSEVLHSLTGYENQALAYYNTPGISMEHGQHISTLSEVDMFRIAFGRWLWDEELAFDPKRFRNPQLRITFDEDLSDNSVTANELEVLARIFDEKPVTPMGYLRSIEHNDYTPGANNSFEVVKLPEDDPIRQILVRAFTDGFEPWTTIKEARLDENNLQRVPFEFTDLEQYYRMMKAYWPLIQTQISAISAAAGHTFYIPQTDFYSGALFAGLGGTTEVFHTNASSKGGKLQITGSGEINILGQTQGYLPWHCYQFPMGRPAVMDDWFEPQGKSPRLRLRAGSNGTSGAVQVILETLRRY